MMERKDIISGEDLKEHLEEQINFLKASAESFDAGFHSEFKRLALAIRILVHDTKVSRSLLTQLNMRDIGFVDSCPKHDPKNLMSFHGLVGVTLGATTVGYVALLDDVPPGQLRRASFEQWWDAVVCVDKEKNVLTRRSLTLAAANQDGGAHVDPRLDAAYAQLKKNSLGWFSVDDSGAQRPFEGAEKASIRQIAHEVLKSLDPEYSKMPNASQGTRLSAVSLTVEGVKIAAGMGERKLGRNEPCFCGSGIKFKRCHGR